MKSIFKEELSIAYLRAICAKDEVSFNLNKRDEDGSDVILKKAIINSDDIKIQVSIDVQLKSTSSRSFLSENDNSYIYKAKQKCYNDLVEYRITPLYLFLLILPQNDEEFISFDLEQLILRKCMYWTKLEYANKNTTDAFVNIVIPKTNYLSPNALLNIINQVGKQL